MTDYLRTFEAAKTEDRWQLVRRWMFGEPLPFFSELRRSRPVLVTPEATLVAGFEDCREVLLRPNDFSVRLYESKQAPYWMAEDDTPDHARDKSIMLSVLDMERVADIRDFVAARGSAILNDAGGQIDLVKGLTRVITVEVVQRWFGFAEADAADLREWSFWNQYDAFHNQSFDHAANQAAIIDRRKAANQGMQVFLAGKVRDRVGALAAGLDVPDDMVTRLVRLSASKALRFDIDRVVLNLGGLLIGTVETTSQAAVNSLAFLTADPKRLAAAQAAAIAGQCDGHVFEALRFHPISPYMFRVCEREAVLGRATAHATTISPGEVVLPLVHSAMFDAAGFDDPDSFDPTRPLANTFHFGLGLHECLGRSIARSMLPEIVKQCLLLPGLSVLSPVDNEGGPFPETYPVRWAQR